MHLSKIKLLGFKSFVDPTTLVFPSYRVGVVGPNGCGKSNIIDAVRWVMGESSAKHLRGAAMVDVIFNGSHTRPPVDQASIELVFEEVHLPQYAQHAEISVKRSLSREGQSNYFINGVRCRRKDVTELFLGTGLGPRSYAIIEQGMISRLIEAKPEELRFFLEEAAGISKYKERRKETEQRIKQVYDNLARLDEIRQELERQLDKLQKQAKQAEKYQALQEEEQLLKAQLLALRWNTFDMIVQEKQHFIDEHSILLQENLFKLQNFDDTYQQQREAITHAQNTLREVQQLFYEVQNKVTQTEQEVTHIQERSDQLEWDLEQLQHRWEQVQHTLQTDEQQLEHLEENLHEIEITLEVKQESEVVAEETVHQAETQWHHWQVQWDDFNQRATEPTQRAQVERTKIQNLEQRLEQTQHTLQRLEEEERSLDMVSLGNMVDHLESKVEQTKNLLDEAHQTLSHHQYRVLLLREELQQSSSQLHIQQTQMYQLSGRLASLEILQEVALGKNSSDLKAWLHRQGFQDMTHLAQWIQVEPRWECAVEKVLGEALKAICIEDLTRLQKGLQTPPKSLLMAFEPHGKEVSSQTCSSKRLLDKVQAPWSLASFLEGVWVAETLEEAYSLRGQLKSYESVITPAGLWFGPDWIYSQQETNEQSGTLAREQEMSHLREQLRNLDTLIHQTSHKLEQQQLELREYEQQRNQAQQQLIDIQEQFSQLQAQYHAKSMQWEHTQIRLQRIAQECEELKERFNHDKQELTSSRNRLHEDLEMMATLADERENLTRQRDEFQEMMLQARTLWRLEKDARHQVEVRLQTLQTDKSRLQQGIIRLQTQLGQLAEQRNEIQKSLRKHTEPLQKLHDQLVQFQQQRHQLEEAHLQAKQTLTHLETALSDKEGQRRTLETYCNQLRTDLEEARIAHQSHQVRRQTLEEQLAQTPYTPISLLAQLPEEANESEWQTKIEALEQKLQRIGAINMAALQEFEEQSLRKRYLDEQAKDLNQALNALQEAISTIDRETKSRFQHTLESINRFLQEMFPRLFGGGQARLELTGEDWLEDGVMVMARPPGKRNTHIHLLSGGEKALTAVALVFAIFELNPAPFCMLDEVDAPLDDTNVGRFCTLVKAMSERVQFIFISHNKITMEIADQLIGVTMQEPGVSRLVSVDLNRAVEMAKG